MRTEKTEENKMAEKKEKKTPEKDEKKVEKTAKNETKPEAETETKSLVEKEVKDEAIAESKPEVKVEPKAEVKTELKAEPKPQTKKEEKPNKKLYGNVMTTGSFVASFLLLLIPGLNIILVILWALGAARNRNKVNFSRSCIIFFLIEVLLTLILLGGTYIYASTQQSKILNYVDQKTNGLLTYFEVNSFNDLPKLLNISDSLISKEEPEPEPEPVPTRIIVNPEEITSYEEFMKLYNDAYATKEVTTEVATEVPTEEVTESVTQAITLTDILKKYNVDPKDAALCYIIIENENSSCIIAFEPTTGKISKVPSLQINDQVIYIGGAK